MEANEWHEGPWFVVYLNRAERETLIHKGSFHRRDGGKWLERFSDSPLKQEVDRFIRSRLGHSADEIWPCDRVFYPGEELPSLQNIRRDFRPYPIRSGDWSYNFSAVPSKINDSGMRHRGRIWFYDTKVRDEFIAKYALPSRVIIPQETFLADPNGLSALAEEYGGVLCKDLTAHIFHYYFPDDHKATLFRLFAS